MHITATMLVHSALAVFITLLAPIHALNSTANTSVVLQASSTNKIYQWESGTFPKSIADLKTRLHLAANLVPGKNPFDIVLDPVAKKSPKLVLRSIYPAGSYSGSGNTKADFTSTPLPKEAFEGTKSRYIRLEYHMLFQPNFDWVLGGKLPGIMLGSEAGCNAGCSGGGTAENCFSTRMMWRAEGAGELYLYAAKSVYFPSEAAETCKRSLDKRSPEALFKLEQKRINAVRIPEDDEGEISSNSTSGLSKRTDTTCLDGMGVTISSGAKNTCNAAYGISIGRGGSFKFNSGTWHNVTQIVRVNSKGNAVRDGYLAVYLDGKSVLKAKNIVLLKKGYNPSTSADDHLVKFMFSSFFGGHTSIYKTPKKQWIAWKGFKMATSLKNIWD